MIIYSIDPGAKGAMSIFEDGKYLSTIKYNGISYWFNEIYFSKKEMEDLIVLVEKVHSMPNQGVVSMFNFGRKLGEIEAMCQILEVEPIFISPREWKSYHGLIGSKKHEACKKALELEPELQCIGSRGGCLDGVADSYLIGRYYIERSFKCKQNKKLN